MGDSCEHVGFTRRAMMRAGLVQVLVDEPMAEEHRPILLVDRATIISAARLSVAHP